MTETSRRTLLRTTAAALGAGPLVAAAATTAAATAAEVGSRASTATRLYRRSRFRPHVGRTFTMVGPRGRRRVVLTAVEDLPGGRPGDQRRFSLTLTAAVPGPPQDSYLLRRRGFRPTTLFLVPSDPERRTYVAIIDTAT